MTKNRRLETVVTAILIAGAMAMVVLAQEPMDFTPGGAGRGFWSQRMYELLSLSEAAVGSESANLLEGALDFTPGGAGRSFWSQTMDELVARAQATAGCEVANPLEGAADFTPGGAGRGFWITIKTELELRNLEEAEHEVVAAEPAGSEAQDDQ